MNAVSGTDQQAQGTVSAGQASRRTFLKGVGLAGAAGLAAPLLARTSASACVATPGPIVLGINAGAWPGGYVSAGSTWPDLVNKLGPSGSHAVGCRSYRDGAFSDATTDPTTGALRPNALGNPVTFPGVPGTKVVASIKPDPAALLNGSLDTVLKQFIEDGAAKGSNGTFAGTPQLTVWHEAGHLYSGSSWSQYGLDPDDNDQDPVDNDGTPTNGTAAQLARSMHVKMRDLCHQFGGGVVEYGCIIYGDIAKMANDNDLEGPTNWVPEPGYPLDWYGIDVYYEDDGTGTDCTHGTLVDRTAVTGYLDPFLTMAQNRTNYQTTRVQPKINICECNANASNFAARPGYFGNLAWWLHCNGLHRMLTFFPPGGGPHSVPWPPIEGTIDALNNIQSTYG